jgi:hypothetical protein
MNKTLENLHCLASSLELKRLRKSKGVRASNQPVEIQKTKFGSSSKKKKTLKKCSTPRILMTDENADNLQQNRKITVEMLESLAAP